MPDPIVWPARILRPLAIAATPHAFTRGGGPSIGGIDRTIRTDRGWWRVAYRGVALSSVAARRMWNTVRVGLAGRAGLIAVPVWQKDIVPMAGPVRVPHADGSPFSDGALYTQPSVHVEMVTEAARGATSVTVRLVAGLDELAGIRFSYLHALYETGLPTAVAGTDWTVPVTPAIRQTIPAGTVLEVDLPTCLVHLVTDDAMEGGYSRGKVDRRDVEFVEATDYWADLVEE